jgi:hypothetical protein
MSSWQTPPSVQDMRLPFVRVPAYAQSMRCIKFKEAPIRCALPHYKKQRIPLFVALAYFQQM